MLRALLTVLGPLLAAWVVWVNIGVHRAPRTGSSEELAAVRAQLAYLGPRMHDGLPDAMQRLFPEGAAFADALYGLTWCQVAERATQDDVLRQQALTEARWALADLERPSVQARFASDDALMLGVFYTGWRNLLIGSIAMLDPSDKGTWARWEQGTDELRQAFASRSSPYLCSYPGMAWPADNVVAIASIVRCARAHGVREDAVVRSWVVRVRAHLDERDLIPHAWDPVADRMADASRGSSQVLMNALLPGIDSAFAAQQFQGLCTHFLMQRCGVPVVREHPRDVMRSGDVDSGPVILGAGATATVVGAAAFRANNDLFHAQELDATCEGFGLAMGGERRRFLAGALPIADLFIAWSRSPAVPRTAGPAPRFLRFHLWSLGLVLVLLAPWWWPWWRRWWHRRSGYLGGMQRTTLLLLLLVAAAPLAAQPVIDAGSAPAVGQSYDYDVADSIALPGLGAAQVWDAGDVIASASDNIAFVNVSTGTAAAAFPNADVLYLNGGGETYIGVENDGFYILGSFNPNLPITSVYSDPQKYMQVPCTLGTAWTDAYNGSYMYGANTFLQSGTTVLEATGYGSLILPWGTVDNVLRLDGTEDYLETGGGNTYTYTATVTLFFKPGLGYFVARNVNGEGVLNGSNVTSVHQFVYMQAGSIGMDEQAMRQLGVDVYPNPAGDLTNVLVTADGPTRMRVLDAGGRVVLDRDLGRLSPGVHREELALTGLPSGLYTVVLHGAEGAWGTARFLVQH